MKFTRCSRRKVIALMVVVAIITWTSPLALALEVSSGPLAVLADAERAVYGKEEGGALLSRVAKLEQDLFGQPLEGALVPRLEKIKGALTGLVGEGSLLTALNSLEWYVSQNITSGPLMTRVSGVEMAILGQNQPGSLGARVDGLVKLLWPDGALTTASVKLGKGSLLKIKLLTELNSLTSKVGDQVKFRVVEDVKVDSRLVVPAGVMGSGKVTEVYTAGNLGRDGRVLVDFGVVQAIDGRNVAVEVAERATEMNKSLQIAAGASMAGVVLLGPVGLVGGLLVKGKNVIIPVGTEFFIEVSNPVDVTGVTIKR